jgi:hypothetical protein
MSAARDAVALRWLPPVLVLAAAAAMIAYGPIAQPQAYHAFADSRSIAGIPSALNVLSNLPFAIVGLWALSRGRAAVAWRVFDIALVLTALGSGYYHLAPGDARLVWDRLPIALACAALLAAVYEQTDAPRGAPARLMLLCIAAVASVVWWQFTDDLRPYLLLQGAPLVLVPLWQWRAGRPSRERILFGAAIACYVLAKAFEALDRPVFEALAVSGHSLKHLLAAAGAFFIVLGRAQDGAN